MKRRNAFGDVAERSREYEPSHDGDLDAPCEGVTATPIRVLLQELELPETAPSHVPLSPFFRGFPLG